MIIFNDLLFDSELVTIESEDVKEIFFDSKQNVYFIENTDGLLYSCRTYTEQ